MKKISPPSFLSWWAWSWVWLFRRMSALHIAEQEDPVQFALPPYAEQPLRLDQQLKMYWKKPKFKKLYFIALYTNQDMYLSKKNFQLSFIMKTILITLVWSISTELENLHCMPPTWPVTCKTKIKHEFSTSVSCISGS